MRYLAGQTEQTVDMGSTARVPGYRDIGNGWEKEKCLTSGSKTSIDGEAVTPGKVMEGGEAASAALATRQ